MDKQQMMAVPANQATMWILSANRKTVRLTVPPLRLEGVPTPLAVYINL